MKMLTTLLVLLLSTPVAAQDGPIARAIRQYARPDVTPTIYTTRMRSPLMFWSGVVLVGGGAAVIISGVTWAQDSDLSLEDANTRLGRDLAPCGTDPQRTRQPIADCKPNTGLLLLGSGMAIGGGLMMIVGGQTIQVVSVGPRSVTMRVRF
jgi:hypothetical protein